MRVRDGWEVRVGDGSGWVGDRSAGNGLDEGGRCTGKEMDGVGV